VEATVTHQVLAYESGRGEASRSAKFFLAIVFIYPLLPLMSLYLTWAIAWFVLGHPPRSSLDDQKFIGGPVDVAYVPTALLLISLPIGLPVGLALGMLCGARYVHSRGWNWWRPSVLAVALLAAYAGGALLLKWDPLSVLYWYMD
jgi:hypothetical protein